MDRKKSKANPNHRQTKTPICNHTKSSVEDTKTVHLDNNTVIHRVRKCRSCGKRFKTREEMLNL